MTPAATRNKLKSLKQGRFKVMSRRQHRHSKTLEYRVFGMRDLEFNPLNWKLQFPV
jgi:hypothetical protein